MMQLTKLLLVILLFAGASCQAQQEGATEKPGDNLDVAAFAQWLEHYPDEQLIDLRRDDEVSGGMIEGAVQIDYFGEGFKEKILALDKSKPVFLYCAAGGRSGKTLNLLKKNGFTDVHHLVGGYGAWSSK